MSKWNEQEYSEEKPFVLVDYLKKIEEQEDKEENQNTLQKRQKENKKRTLISAICLITAMFLCLILFSTAFKNKEDFRTAEKTEVKEEILEPAVEENPKTEQIIETEENNIFQQFEKIDPKKLTPESISQFILESEALKETMTEEERKEMELLVQFYKELDEYIKGESQD